MVLLSKRVKLNQLKSLKKDIDWCDEEERYELLEQIDSLIRDWEGELPDLRDAFTSLEIDILLMGALDLWEEDHHYYYDQLKRFIDLLIRAGYKDEFGVKEAGKEPLDYLTLVHDASRFWRLPNISLVICELFKIYYDVNYIDNEGLTHFHVACEFGCYDVAKKFLELGHDPNYREKKKGYSALHLAIIKGQIEVIELLLKNGGDPNLGNYKGLTPLHVICSRDENDDSLLEQFFKINDELHLALQVNAGDKWGNTPLHLAMDTGAKKAIELLLRNDADPNVPNKMGLTPLHRFCTKLNPDLNRCEFIQKFFDISDELNRPVQIDAKDENDRSPLQWAIVSCSPKTVNLLLDRGADLSSFVFPTEAHFYERFNRKNEYLGFNSILNVLAIVEILEKRGYQLTQSDTLTIMNIYAEFRFFEKSSDFDKYLHDDENFTSKAKEIMINPSLSLHDLIKLRPDEATKQLKLEDYLELAHLGKLRELPIEHQKACGIHLYEKLSRRSFRRWALYPFWEQVVHYQLPILCCDMIIKNLENEDLYNICLAATNPNQERFKKNVKKYTKPARARKAPKRLKYHKM